MVDIEWLGGPNASNYPAAESYLTLLYDESKVKIFVERLKLVKVCSFKAKDIFRASNLSLLGVSNFHVKQNKQKIKKGIHMSPILLVRDELRGRVIVADGYHRLCAVYHYNEDAHIPCKIV